MKIGKTLHLTNRNQWREWLENNYDSASEIWLIYYKKASGIDFIPYDDAVEEALCFGWIDSIIKKIDDEKRAQRFSPRNSGSILSELNKERIRRMQRAGKMTSAGWESIKKHVKYSADGEPEIPRFKIPEDILDELKKDPVLWKNFNTFPDYYREIRCGFIEGARSRPEEFKKRLDYFIKMTSQNKKYGTMT